jgi:hypothetical protein
MFASPDARQDRFTEPLKFLPIAFVCSTMLGLYLIYLICHLLPMLQLSEKPEHVDGNARHTGVVQCVLFHIFTGLLLCCYVRAILTHPGGIPDDDPNWNLTVEAPTGVGDLTVEKRGDGKRRMCKWCQKYKPDRCHHCRICRRCILKMDHHCPWIYNCVGWGNYKYFLLLLFYTACDLHLIVWTMAGSVQQSFVETKPFLDVFIVLFGETIAVFLGILLTLFFIFHCLLVMNATTTIEFCERKGPRAEGQESTGSLYDVGHFGNITSVLGNNPLLWFIPVSTHDRSKGLYFMTSRGSITRDLEKGRGSAGHKNKKKHHKSAQAQGISYGTWTHSMAQA